MNYPTRFFAEQRNSVFLTGEKKIDLFEII